MIGALKSLIPLKGPLKMDTNPLENLKKAFKTL